jgi:hypothetical protein
MDEDLQQLARELRKETCPQRVVDEVARRISGQTPPPNRFNYRIAVALGALIALCGIGLWRWPAAENTPRASEVAQKEAIDRALVARQAEGTFAYIGQVMLHASEHSEKVILNEAVPQLRNSFETAKNKIMNRIDL